MAPPAIHFQEDVTPPGPGRPNAEIPFREPPTPEPGREPLTPSPGREPPTPAPGREPPTPEPGREPATPQPGREPPTPVPQPPVRGTWPRTYAAFALAALVAGCGERSRDGAELPEVSRVGGAEVCDAPEVRAAVTRLGDALARVSLLAPEPGRSEQMRAQYAPLVAPALLEAWLADPERAPGRTVSSPWPERIEVTSSSPAGAGGCRVEGEVVYVTSAEAQSAGAPSREPVVLRVDDVGGGWRVADYRAGSSAPPDPGTPQAADVEEAVAVVRRYYDAIRARDFGRAYELWGEGGPPGGQSLEDFAAGYAETVSVELEVGTPGRIEPAAGSRYLEVPVTLRAVTRAGAEQRFAGSYTVRRVVVDGADPAERRWHLHAASLAPVR